MRRRSGRLLAAIAALIVLAVAILQAGAVAPGNEHFQRTWARTDQPVRDGDVLRTWVWAPEAFTPVLNEPYAESPGGQRQVQYFDKARMEINDPDRDPASPFYVTNGLLVIELMTGNLQLGASAFEQHSLAQVNVAGDPDDPLTYADLAPLRSAPALADGSTITQTVDSNGVVGDDPSLASHGVTAASRVTVPGIDHQVASPFWNFLNSSGPVIVDGQLVTERLFDPWFYATGYPITEAYWATVKVGGTPRLVLLQCFERRCLTYTPGNPEGFLVEAGNVGQHYHRWRYEQIPNEGTPTPTASATSTATETPAASPTGTATETPTGTPTPIEEPATEYEFVTAWGDQYNSDSPFVAPIAAATDSAGNVYVVEAANHRVQKYDSNGVYITGWGSEGSGNSEFNVPIGIAIDAADNVYVADSGNQRIQKFSANGAYITQWAASSGDFAPAGDPQAIAVGPDDRIYVGILYASGGSAVIVYDNTGDYLTLIGSPDSGLEQFSIPRGLAFDSQGQLYILDAGNNRVQQRNAAHEYISGWGSTGTGDHQFMGALGIAIDADDTVYITDVGNHRVTAFAPGGGYIGELVQPFKSFFPVGAAVDGDDNLYIVDNDHGVLKFDAERAFQFSWNDDRRGKFGSPVGIAVAADGTILVSDELPTANRILRFSDGGFHLSEWGSLGSEPGQFKAPSGLAVNSLGQIYVTDRDNYRIQKFSAEGSYISQWGRQGAGDGEFSSPVYIAVDADDNVYVTDESNDRLQKFDDSGNYLGQWGGNGNGDGQFNSPNGIAIHGSTVYVADRRNNRVQAFDLDGNYLFQWGEEGSGEGQFNLPEGIAVDAQGYVYIVDNNNNRVQKFTPDGEFLATLGATGSGPGQFSCPRGIAVDDGGNVYVTDNCNFRVQKFAPVE